MALGRDKMDMLMLLTLVLTSIIARLVNHAVTNALKKDLTFECIASRHQQHWRSEGLAMWLVSEKGTTSAVQIDTKKRTVERVERVGSNDFQDATVHQRGGRSTQIGLLINGNGFSPVLRFSAFGSC